MEYFTENGYEQVCKKHEGLINKDYFFDYSKSNPKEKLISFDKHPSGYTLGGFYVNCVSDKGNFLPIYKFMELNEIEYNFRIFDRIVLEYKQV